MRKVAELKAALCLLTFRTKCTPKYIKTPYINDQLGNICTINSWKGQAVKPVLKTYLKHNHGQRNGTGAFKNPSLVIIKNNTRSRHLPRPLAV